MAPFCRELTLTSWMFSGGGCCGGICCPLAMEAMALRSRKLCLSLSWSFCLCFLFKGKQGVREVGVNDPGSMDVS